MMTTENLRKTMHVTSWSLTENGLTLSYTRQDFSPKTLHLVMTPEQTLRELNVIGDLDNISDDCTRGSIDGVWYVYSDLVKVYQMCQWEALTIAIKHEAENDLMKDIKLLEMDEAIRAILK